MKTQTKLGLVVLGLAAATVVAPPSARANLLVDSEFDAPLDPGGDAAVLGPPFKTGTWGAEDATIVNTGLPPGLALPNPKSGNSILNIQNDGGIASQVFQVVPVTPGTPYTLTAWFASNVSGAVGIEQLLFFNSTTNQWDNPITAPPGVGTIGLSSTWQLVTETEIAPLNPGGGTEYAVVQLYYANTGAAPGSSLGYVDQPSLTAPEPASMLLFASGFLGLLLARRKAK